MNRIKSSFDEHTEFNLWETPVMDFDRLYLLGTITSSMRDYYFFFGKSVSKPTCDCGSAGSKKSTQKTRRGVRTPEPNQHS